MIGFILIACLITMTSVALLIRPLLVKRPGTNKHATGRRDHNIALARKNLQELSSEYENGLLDEALFQQQRLELESRLLSDIQHDATQQTEQQTANWLAITLIATLIPFAALVMYLLTGTPAALNSQTANPAPTSDVEEIVNRLQNSLKGRPDDIQGWTLMARTYAQLGRLSQARDAFAHLVEIDANNADHHTALADIEALLNDNNLLISAIPHIDAALAINADHPQALWLAGLAAAQSAQHKLAVKYWQRLLPLLADAPEQQARLQEIIDEAKSAESPINLSTGITVRVSLDKTINVEVNKEDSVFVFAREINGLPTPLAVRRLQVKDLPVEIHLNDHHAMTENRKLSDFTHVQIGARLSKTGQASAQVGDFQSDIKQVTTQNTETVELLINQLID